MHIIDPYLKQFKNELYAQGRKEYENYVTTCLLRKAHQVETEFRDICKSNSFIPAEIKRIEGDPLQLIMEYITSHDADIVILGGKCLGFWARFRSRNLPNYISQRCSKPVLIIRK